MNPLRLTSTLAAAAALTFALAGCSGSSGASTAPPAGAATTSAATAGFPVTVTVPGAAPVHLDHAPTRIAVLSPDAAVAVAELGAADRVVAVPSGATNSTLVPDPDTYAKVEHTISDDTSPDVEQILSWKPDLVVVTARHTGEKDASSQLTNAGIPVLTFTNGWSTADAITTNLTLLGKALGSPDAATKLVSTITSGVASAKTATASVSTRPKVLVLSNQAGTPFVNASSVITSQLVTLAGGVNAADAAGVHATRPVNPELIVKAAPDYIMLVDVLGKGRSSFDSMLSNPAVKALPAVENGHVKLFAARDVYGLAGREVVSGTAAVRAWIHPELG
ncbi:hypothetical protein GCM10023221_13220 [Luteimicrobium xylanilyticum]|uniref:Fe/B12 periplasmic-binding domain-containing protein n=1 Tax=Luteimicrobium xylanilyticum TaxID=1133546 RepID=A0A5P9QD87_9MICO|nr:ABC transporter substrate-binding protein [Luteimicrobium xylanilyticum]QFU99206.1 hypothetical protein KDY119_02732 [Luteimicrobium xylanilyticum]